jgi:hypothetical protein
MQNKEIKINKINKSFVVNRRHRVNLYVSNTHNYYSTWETVTYRVAQGSVVGLLIFIININNLTMYINHFTDVVLFAYDTSVLKWGDKWGKTT